MSVRSHVDAPGPAYLRRGTFGVDVFASSLAGLLDLLLLFVDHDLASLQGATFRESELWPRDCAALGDDLKEESNLCGMRQYPTRLAVGRMMTCSTFSVSVHPLTLGFSAMFDDVAEECARLMRESW